MNRSTRRLVIIVTAALVCAGGLYVVPKKPLPVIAPQDVEWAADAGDYRKAYRLLERLAESGNIKAQGFLAFVLYEGEWGVTVDDARAKAWMEKAYAQNDPYAHFYVAMINEPVDGKEPDLDSNQIRTPDWKADVAIAAEGGIPYAQNLMGDWAKEQHKYKEAIEWYRGAAGEDRDYYAVDYYLAETFYTSPKRFHAKQLLDRVTSGNADGYGALSVAYTFGFDVPIDHEKAYMYGAISVLFGEGADARARKVILESLPKEKQSELATVAVNLIQSWMTEPTTYIGQGSAWCLDNNDKSIGCILSAVEAHRFCEADYAMWHFETLTQFPAYKACRKWLYK